MADYRVEIKHRGRPPKPYAWEIYDGEKTLPIKESANTYPSRQKADEAGSIALMSLLDARQTARKREGDRGQLLKRNTTGVKKSSRGQKASSALKTSRAKKKTSQAKNKTSRAKTSPKAR